ncbi:ATP-binding cassette domain-containing protein [Hymenobacter humi]|uniref:ATP-binding cassette domain-containing protein n=1 Tax=Hymenobacter humi TaxID=1411620 RepID=A0ABW2U5A4_9BACT
MAWCFWGRTGDAGQPGVRAATWNPAGPQVLEADGIQVAFGARQVLANIYLRVQTGQIVGLLGRNGSGKSVLLQTVFEPGPWPMLRCA